MALNITEIDKIRSVCSLFGIEGELVECEPIEIGNINRTYRLTLRRDGELHYYVPQLLNTYVFRQPEEVMRNIRLITRHIHDKIVAAGLSTRKMAVKFYDTADGRNFLYDENGGFWRVSRFIENSITYDLSSDKRILEGGGAAFGSFQMLLSDFDAAQLSETIPDFHNTRKRLETLFADAKRDDCGRADSVRDELNFFSTMYDTASRLTNMLEAGEVPLRVTHNDTKVNNVLFDRDSGEPLVVVDLDTVMPGLAMHDFGDAVRSAACTTDEDEVELSKVELDPALYEAFANGFIPKVANSLTEPEINTMALGALTITVELASRFLDDYITGDHYFRTTREGHNLDRARCQIKLAKDISEKLPELERMVRVIARNS